MITRHEQIIRMLSNGKRVKIQDFVDAFEVSVSTIRRDLDFLSEEGLIKKVYGGAVLANRRGLEPSIEERTQVNFNEKEEIANKIIELLEDGDTIAIDNGTTCNIIAKKLIALNNLTIITNSLNVAISCISNQINNVYLVGGKVRSGEMATSGSLANDVLSQFNVDKCIISTSGISLNGYLTEYNLEEAAIRKTMMSISKMSIVVADNTKFGKEAFAKVCHIRKFDILVTDNKTKTEHIELVKNNGVEVI